MRASRVWYRSEVLFRLNTRCSSQARAGENARLEGLLLLLPLPLAVLPGESFAVRCSKITSGFLGPSARALAEEGEAVLAGAAKPKPKPPPFGAMGPFPAAPLGRGDTPPPTPPSPALLLLPPPMEKSPAKGLVKIDMDVSGCLRRSHSEKSHRRAESSATALAPPALLPGVPEAALRLSPKKLLPGPGARGVEEERKDPTTTPAAAPGAPPPAPPGLPPPLLELPHAQPRSSKIDPATPSRRGPL